MSDTMMRASRSACARSAASGSAGAPMRPRGLGWARRGRFGRGLRLDRCGSAFGRSGLGAVGDCDGLMGFARLRLARCARRRWKRRRLQGVTSGRDLGAGRFDRARGVGAGAGATRLLRSVEADAAEPVDQRAGQRRRLDVVVGAVDLVRARGGSGPRVWIAPIRHDVDHAQALVALDQLADLEAEHLRQRGVEHDGARQRALHRQDRLDAVVRDEHLRGPRARALPRRACTRRGSDARRSTRRAWSKSGGRRRSGRADGCLRLARGLRTDRPSADRAGCSAAAA